MGGISVASKGRISFAGISDGTGGVLSESRRLTLKSQGLYSPIKKGIGVWDCVMEDNLAETRMVYQVDGFGDSLESGAGVLHCWHTTRVSVTWVGKNMQTDGRFFFFFSHSGKELCSVCLCVLGREKSMT